MPGALHPKHNVCQVRSGFKVHAPSSPSRSSVLFILYTVYWDVTIHVALYNSRRIAIFVRGHEITKVCTK